MAKYILVKKVKGKKYEYQVIDVDSKAIVSKRTSAREYVACTADGSFYFGRLDLMGNEDCPECGGEMEVTDGEYKQTGGDGYLTPPEYTAIWEEMTCTHCGHKESNEPSY